MPGGGMGPLGRRLPGYRKHRPLTATPLASAGVAAGSPRSEAHWTRDYP